MDELLSITHQSHRKTYQSPHGMHGQRGKMYQTVAEIDEEVVKMHGRHYGIQKQCYRTLHQS